MAEFLIRKTNLPPGSLAQRSFVSLDYQDTYYCEFKSEKQLKVEDTVLAFFNAAPKIVSVLFNIRNALMKPFGLKVNKDSDHEQQLANFKVEKGQRLGLFQITEKENNEVLLGEDDKHLNFRISFLLSKHDSVSSTYTFALSTIVLINNNFGKLYFIPVKPFHKLIVRSMIRNIVKQLSST